jgi:hypothetical protein
LEIAFIEHQIVFKGYFFEETLRYIVANQINDILSKKDNLVSFPNKKENAYKLVFQYPYTDNKKSQKKNLEVDLAIIRTNAEKFNDANRAVFYKKTYIQAIFHNKGFELGNDEVLSFDNDANSFVIYSNFDNSKYKYRDCKFINDGEAFKKIQAYKEKKRQQPKEVDFIGQTKYRGNLIAIELKQFSSYKAIEDDIKRLKGILDPNKGFESFNFGVLINFGFNNIEASKKLVEYLKSETLEKRNLLVAYLDTSDQKGIQMKWIN